MKRLKRWQKVLLILFGLVLVGLFLVDRWLRPYDLETERTLARAAGVPLTEADLKIRVPSADEDAAPLYQRLADLENDPPLDAALLKRADARQWPGGPPTPDAVSAARKLVSGRPDISRVVHDAAAKPYAYFPHSWELTAAEVFPTMARVREAAKWLRLESMVLAADGGYEAAVHNYSLGFRCADHAAEDPTVISLLVSLVCESTTVRGLGEVLRLTGPDEAASTAVERALAANPPQRDLARALGGETVLGLDAMSRLPPVSLQPGSPSASADEAAVPSAEGAGGFTRRYVTDPMSAVHLHYMRRFVEAARIAPPQRDRTISALQREMARRSRRTPAFALTRIVVPEYSGAVERCTLADAQRAVLLAAAHVMSHKARTGRWPETLEKTLSSVTTDPFTGKPLGYRVEGNGFVVYSVGEKGGFEAKPGQPEKGQAFFRYPRPNAVKDAEP